MNFFGSVPALMSMPLLLLFTTACSTYFQQAITTLRAMLCPEVALLAFGVVAYAILWVVCYGTLALTVFVWRKLTFRGGGLRRKFYRYVEKIPEATVAKRVLEGLATTS